METVSPWGFSEVKDYSHVFKEFGLNPLDKKFHLDHFFFERNIIVAHRDFDRVFEAIKRKKPFINITGIACSGQLHFGHKVDLDLFVLLKKLGARTYFTVADLDGFLSRPDTQVPSIDAAKKIAVDNLSHALALGISEKDVYLQSNGSRKNPVRYLNFAFELSKKITANTFESAYGHVDLGKVASNFLQYADILHAQLPEFEGEMPSVTGIGLDQDPHARISRDIAKRLPYKMFVPSFVYFKHMRGLREGAKMSSSRPEATLFLSDSPKEAEQKINRAFTGGRETIELHRKLGGVPEICRVYELLEFNLSDSKKLKKIYDDYKSGALLSKEIKDIAIDLICPWLQKHQEKVEQKKEVAKQIVFG